jgi:hypothetical protein
MRLRVGVLRELDCVPTEERQPACCSLDSNHLALPAARACGKWNTRRLRDNRKCRMQFVGLRRHVGMVPPYVEHLFADDRVTEADGAPRNVQLGTCSPHVVPRSNSQCRAIRHAHELERPVQRPRPNHESVLRHCKRPDMPRMVKARSCR